ncbi:serine/threonine-protein kinase DDB_G0283821-like, partial [Symsagittifera roscoffensis]|uniref:serine/threonine-protein kinase DDB_G0283821-like n=1 Tax=Symsagittifera roscoffensis TaxID=84072 RepID=UPI00307BB8D1
MGGIWASSAVVGVPMGVFYEYKKVEIPEEGDTQAPEYACFIRGGDLQFLLTNVTVYIVDFLVPAVLVTKYYWEFSVEVRRRSGGVTSTTNAPAASNTPQNNNNNNNNNNGNSMQHGNGIPRCNAISQVPPLRASQENRTHSNHPRGTCLNGVVNNCTTGDVEETPPSEHIELAKSAQSSCDVTVMTASTSRPKVAHCLSNTGNQNSKNDINSNNINNSSISGHNSNAAVSPNTANSNTNPGAILAH